MEQFEKLNKRMDEIVEETTKRSIFDNEDNNVVFAYQTYPYFKDAFWSYNPLLVDLWSNNSKKRKRIMGNDNEETKSEWPRNGSLKEIMEEGIENNAPYFTYDYHPHCTDDIPDYRNAWWNVIREPIIPYSEAIKEPRFRWWMF